MSWKYQQTTGQLINPEGEIVGKGYSGHGDGLNNPIMQHVPDIGPIPRGLWFMTKFFDSPGDKGPMVCALIPANGTNTFGRSGFMIHGDNIVADHSASEGCIILARYLRNMIKESKNAQLEVME